MCVECAKKVVDLLDQMEKGGEWKGLSEDEKEVERQTMGMRIRAGIKCPKGSLMERKWIPKPIEEGIYLMRSGDHSAWTKTRCVRVYSRQEYGSLVVNTTDWEDMGCVEDYSGSVDWLLLISHKEEDALCQIKKDKDRG